MELNVDSIPFHELGPILRGITYNGRAGLIARYTEGSAAEAAITAAPDRPMGGAHAKGSGDAVLTLPAGALSVDTVVDAYLNHLDRNGSHPSVVVPSGITDGSTPAASGSPAASTPAGSGSQAVSTPAVAWVLEAVPGDGSSQLGNPSRGADSGTADGPAHSMTTARAQVVAGKVALVTGAAQGFGWEIAQGLAAAAAYVVIADLNQSGAEERAAELGAISGDQLPDGSHLGLPVDVSKEESVRELVTSIRRRYGGLDLVVSNAGVLKAGPVTELELSDFELVTKVNYTGFFLVTKNAAPVLGLQNAAYQALLATHGAPLGSGVDGTAAGRRTAGSTAKSGPKDYDCSAYYTDIVEMNSKSGLEGSNKNAAYAGSKFGGIGLVQSFALELVEHAIKVNALCPGNFLDGPLWSDPDRGLFVQYLRAGKVPGAKTIADVRTAYEAKVPMNRGCTGRDVVRALLYLVEQRYETGQALPITGGQVMLS